MQSRRRNRIAGRVWTGGTACCISASAARWLVHVTNGPDCTNHRRLAREGGAAGGSDETAALYEAELLIVRPEPHIYAHLYTPARFLRARSPAGRRVRASALVYGRIMTIQIYFFVHECASFSSLRFRRLMGLSRGYFYNVTSLFAPS